MRISVDDGCQSDMRLGDLARMHNLELVIYLPVMWKEYARQKGFKPLLVPQALDLVHEFELGSHTISHRLLTKIPLDEAKEEIFYSKIYLQQKFGRHIRKFAPPRGYITPELTKYALKHYDEIRLTRQPNLVHIHPNSGANGNKPWREAINENTTELFCHSHELDKFNLWEELEAYLEDSHS